MPPEHLANLARIGQLKVEARNAAEVARMLKLAKTRLADAQLPHVSRDGRFASSYRAGHAAVAALRGEYVDLLVRVTGRDSAERLLYIHVEVQTQRDEAFASRMFTYHHRLIGVIDLFAIIDWMLTLPKPREQQVWQDIENIEKKSQMKYVTSVERLAIQRGHVTGRLEGRLAGKLETLTRLRNRRFGPLPEWVAHRLSAGTGEQLDAWSDRFLNATTLAEVFEGH
jgi:hypothetical protein